MDQIRIDLLARAITGPPSRRDVLRGLVGAGLGLGASRQPDGAPAKKKRRKNKKAKPNEFGCLNVGDACKNDGQCCSGVCERKGKRRKCLVHNDGLCRPHLDSCTAGVDTVCQPGAINAKCWLTTGKAGFCGHFGTGGSQANCRNCAKDADCQSEFGPSAACIDLRGPACPGTCANTGGTACMTAVV